jgi:hypothetical protein
MGIAELFENAGARGVAVAQDATELPAVYQRFQQRRRKAVLVLGKIAPVEQHRHAGDLPMPGRGVLAAGQLAGVAIGPGHFDGSAQPRRKFPAAQRGGMAQAQA